MTTIIFAGERIGLIIRGKTGETHHPGVMEQHADCILSDGSCIGFFGEGRDGSSGSSGSTGMNMKGAVYDMAGLARHRPYYIDAKTAKGYNVQSTALVLFVGNKLAKAFDEAWQDLTSDPPGFWLAGANCSTRASDAFRKSGVLSGGIPGLDTPDHLYAQLQKVLGDKATSYSGYIGFAKREAGYALVIEAATK